MAAQTIADTLPEQLKPLYETIVREIQPFVETESWTQAIGRIDMILPSIPMDQANRTLRAALLAKRGELNMEDEDLDQAEEDVRHALHNGLRVAPVYVIAGWVHYQRDEYDKSREYFDRALEDNPNHTDALTGRSMVLQELGLFDMARADITHALRHEPRNASLWAMRAEVHILLENLEQASSDIKKAREFDPEDTDYALIHARIEAVQGRFQEASKIVNAAITDDEDLTLEALLLRSHLSLLTGNTKGARADAMNASNRFSDEAFAFVQLAQVQLAEDNISLALKAAERAVKLDASLPDAYLIRGAARQAKGDSAGAKEDFDRSLDVPPEFPQFIFGAAYDAVDQQSFNASVSTFYQNAQPKPAPKPVAAQPEAPSGNPFAGMPGMGMMGNMMGGMDPMKMMGQLFDDQGNIRPMFKPFLKMALKKRPLHAQEHAVEHDPGHGRGPGDAQECRHGQHLPR